MSGSEPESMQLTEREVIISDLYRLGVKVPKLLEAAPDATNDQLRGLRDGLQRLFSKYGINEEEDVNFAS